MKNKLKDFRVWITAIIILVIVAFLLSRFYTVNYNSKEDFQRYCTIGLGEDWTYVDTSFYGLSCARPTGKVGTYKLYNFTIEQMETYCKKPSFWNLASWKSDCR